MEGCVQVISREIVKPSSPIHKHPKKLKLSYLDQLAPHVYVPIIFFYEADESKGLSTFNHEQISQHLKHSLSHILTSFYPLAGRYDSDDTSVVDCNDAGIEFVDARIHVALTDAIKDSSMKELKQYVPIDPNSAITQNVLVQITFFDCGGIALCVCFSHLIADMNSMATFINAWADTTRDQSSQLSQLVTFDLAKYFPKREIKDSSSARALLTNSNEMCTTKRFVFHKEVIAHLKRDAILSSGVKDPSRVELVSAFIWRHIIEVAKSKVVSVVASHTVNLRKKKLPTDLLENVFGNCFMLSIAISDAQHEGDQDLVSKLRSSIRNIDDEYITKAQSGDDYMNDLYKVMYPLMKGELELCIFSSWCRFPLYEVDYGFGKPFWLCTTAIPKKNQIRMVDSKCGHNIEAWVNMEYHNLEILENKMKDLMLQSSSHN